MTYNKTLLYKKVGGPLFVILISISALASVLLLPCKESMIIGFCGIGRGVAAFTIIGLFGVYALVVAALRRFVASSNKVLAFRSEIILTMLIVCVSFVFALSLVRTTAALQPEALTTLRTKGISEVQFLSFSEVPILNESKQIIGLRMHTALTVAKSGVYTIYPLRTEGLVRLAIREADGHQLALPNQVTLDGGKQYDFTYVAWIDTPPSGEGLLPWNTHVDYAAWKIG